MDPLFVQAFVYLAAALVVVPIAARLGLGSVLGYLIAGALIGPFALDLVGEDGEEVMHFAEFGVVMMLFLVGLELEPERLWRLRGPILGLGGLQLLVTTALLAGGAMAIGLPWNQAVAVGLVLSMSSTAIALQTLSERNLLKTDAGQKAFSVLLFQDIAVIPILAVLPLLAISAGDHHGDAHGGSLVDDLSGPVWALLVLLTVAAIAAAGRFLVRPALRVVARTGMRELFTGAALLIVIGVTLLMIAVGLSPALGTFLAGVVLANSEYRHELESDIEPFKGLLLGLFFMSVGASLDVRLVVDAPLMMGGLLVGIVTVKAAVLLGLGLGAKAGAAQAVLFTLSLSQVGEFAFVLLAFAVGAGVVDGDIGRTLTAVTALSMAVSPLLFAFGERVVVPRLSATSSASKEPDVVDEEHPVLIAGFGRFGQIAGRFLRGNGVGVTVLDVDSDQVEVVRGFGQKVFYGDASRHDLLHAAGAGKAKLLIVAVDDHRKALQIVHTARKHFPHLQILARARGRTEAYELMDQDLAGVYRETFHTSLVVGGDALRILGCPAEDVERALQVFRAHDEQAVKDLAPHRGDREQLQRSARERVRELEKALARDADDALREAANEGDARRAEPVDG